MPSSSGIIALPALPRHAAPFSTAKTAHLLMPKEMETYHICIHKFIGKMPENVNSGEVIVCAIVGCQKAHISSDILIGANATQFPLFLWMRPENEALMAL